VPELLGEVIALLKGREDTWLAKVGLQPSAKSHAASNFGADFMSTGSGRAEYALLLHQFFS
jgi:hypothetical protein